MRRKGQEGSGRGEPQLGPLRSREVKVEDADALLGRLHDEVTRDGKAEARGSRGRGRGRELGAVGNKDCRERQEDF